MFPYPTWAPPEEVARIPREAWTARQAEAYATWFHSIAVSRVSGLQAYFGKDGRAIDESLILELGKDLENTLPQRQFSAPSPHGPELTNQGYGMAADMGLLGARFLEDRYPHLRWSIVRKPKSDISVNLPVLIGFGVVPLDPILVSINTAHGMLAGNRKGDAWLKVFKHWGSEAEKHSTGTELA